MTTVQNPLITYMTWLVDQDLGWADSIAAGFFESWQIMDETKKLLDVPKEEYEAKLREISNYMDAHRRGEECVVPAMLNWEEGDYDYGDEGNDKEYINGIRLKRLVVYLNKFIELNNERYIEKIALQLFHHTDFMLLSYTIGEPPVNLTDVFRNRYINSLLKGDMEQAGKERHEIYLMKEEQAALLSTKASWDDFSKEDFNQAVILDYHKRRLYGS